MPTNSDTDDRIEQLQPAHVPLHAPEKSPPSNGLTWKRTGILVAYLHAMFVFFIGFHSITVASQALLPLIGLTPHIAIAIVLALMGANTELMSYVDRTSNTFHVVFKVGLNNFLRKELQKKGPLDQKEFKKKRRYLHGVNLIAILAGVAFFAMALVGSQVAMTEIFHASLTPWLNIILGVGSFIAAVGWTAIIHWNLREIVIRDKIKDWKDEHTTSDHGWWWSKLGWWCLFPPFLLGIYFCAGLSTIFQDNKQSKLKRFGLAMWTLLKRLSYLAMFGIVFFAIYTTCNTWYQESRRLFHYAWFSMMLVISSVAFPMLLMLGHCSERSADLLKKLWGRTIQALKGYKNTLVTGFNALQWHRIKAYCLSINTWNVILYPLKFIAILVLTIIFEVFSLVSFLAHLICESAIAMREGSPKPFLFVPVVVIGLVNFIVEFAMDFSFVYEFIFGGEDLDGDHGGHDHHHGLVSKEWVIGKFTGVVNKIRGLWKQQTDVSADDQPQQLSSQEFNSDKTLPNCQGLSEPQLLPDGHPTVSQHCVGAG